MEMITTMKYPMIRENITGLNETNLVSTAQKGDLEAFNQMVLFYQDRIFSLALRILGDEDSAEDITQNTFLTAYLKLHQFRNGSFCSWLYRIATNACIDEIRRHKSHPILPLEYDDDVEEKLFPVMDFPDPGILPEIEVEKHELEQVVQKAINRLDEDQRVVVVLVDLQERDYQETAQILGIPLGTVKSRLARARLRLHNLLKDSSGIK
jgi:RNA polymerase sigma-70 factor, ECF subfamily